MSLSAFSSILKFHQKLKIFDLSCWPPDKSCDVHRYTFRELTRGALYYTPSFLKLPFTLVSAIVQYYFIPFSYPWLILLCGISQYSFTSFVALAHSLLRFSWLLLCLFHNPCSWLFSLKCHYNQIPDVFNFCTQ